MQNRFRNTAYGKVTLDIPAVMTKGARYQVNSYGPTGNLRGCRYLVTLAGAEKVYKAAAARIDFQSVTQEMLDSF